VNTFRSLRNRGDMQKIKFMKIHGKFTEIHVFFKRELPQINRKLFVNTFRSLRNRGDMQKIKFMKIHGKFTEIHVFIITRIATN